MDFKTNDCFLYENHHITYNDATRRWCSENLGCFLQHCYIYIKICIWNIDIFSTYHSEHNMCSLWRFHMVENPQQYLNIFHRMTIIILVCSIYWLILQCDGVCVCRCSSTTFFFHPQSQINGIKCQFNHSFNTMLSCKQLRCILHSYTHSRAIWTFQRFREKKLKIWY